MFSDNLRRRMEIALADPQARDELFSGGRTFGKSYFVDYDHGADTNDGLSMDTAKKTVLAAYNCTTTNKHDVIYLSAYSAHPIASELTVSKNRVHFVGLDPAGGRYMGQRARLEMGVTTGTGIALLNVQGNGCSFTNLKFVSTDTLASSVFAVADGGEYTVFRNCHFDKQTDLDQAAAGDLLCNGDMSQYFGCYFGNNTTSLSSTRGNVLFTRETISGKVARDVIFEDCIFTHRESATTAVHIKMTANDIERMCLFKNCIFWNDVLSSATQALVFGVAAALTDGMVLLKGCVTINVTDTCATSKNVWTHSAAASTTGDDAVLTATS